MTERPLGCSPKADVAKHSGLVCPLAGHYHRNAGGVARGQDGRELEVVVTAAVGANLTTNPDGDAAEQS